MPANVWYSGEYGVSALARRLLGVAGEYRRLRRGFHWDTPRPASWPERSNAVPERASDLGWARLEPVRSLRYAIQRFLSIPFAEVMTHPQVEGSEWVQELDRPAIMVANHNSHADTPLLLYALGERVREKTVVAAAADYFYERPWIGRVVSLWLNTFPFARTGGAQEVMHKSSNLLKSGWNLLVFPEGTRSPDGRLQPFKPGVGHLATENHTPVIPIHLQGSRRVMPKGRNFPLPAPVKIRIGKPLEPGAKETSREFGSRVEAAVQALAAGSQSPQITGSWIERWNAGAQRPARR
jgi:1-acyl-sn-glycerol-3-phosphate acyltransferase